MPTAKKKKILVVDDEPGIALMVKAYLECHKYEVIIAYDGKKGLEKFEKEKPDLVILDTMLPYVKSYEFCFRIKSNNHSPKIPVIMLTARIGDIDKYMEFQYGADSYIPKPFCTDMLLDEVERLLETS